MPILDFDKLTPDNQAVKDLKDLIQLTVFQNEYLQTVVTQCFVNNKSEIWS